MPKSTDKKTANKKSPDTSTRNTPGTNPNVTSRHGGVNPSAPASGTEGWGNTSDERRVLEMNDPAGTRAGQMQGNPGDNQAEAARRASERASTNKRREDDPGTDQADLSRRASASAYSMNVSHGGADHTFRCADVGNSDCRWETSGDVEDETMRRVEEHWRAEHGLTDWTEAMRNRVRDNIHRREAA